MGREEGSALFEHASRFNHSCAPNATWCTAGKNMIVFAVKDIQPGDEVTVLFRDDLKGRGDLKKCPCPLCEDDAAALPVPRYLSAFGSSPKKACL